MPGPEEVKNINTVGLNPDGIKTSPAETPKIQPGEQLKRLADQTERNRGEITRATISVVATETELEKIREKLGLSPMKEVPPSISLEKKRLSRLQAEQETLERQREELVNQQEKEKLIKEEKEKILQEMLDRLFEEFKTLNPRELENISQSGKTISGLNFESRSMGSLNPEVAQSLAQALKGGIKLLPEILKKMPELSKFLEKFDEEITEEAIRSVEEKLEKEKQEIEAQKDKIPQDEAKTESKTEELSS